MAAPLYSARVLDHYRNPRNIGSFDPSDTQVGTAMIGTPELGGVLKLQIRLQGATIEDACFRAFGCGSTIAAASLATVWLKGHSIEQALAIHSQDFVRELELPPVKAHCAMLAEDAIRAAVADYTQKQR